jgi:membrane protease YdiL (CAAX protease family)
LLEVLGVYVAGNLLVVGVVRLLGVQAHNPLADFTADITDAQLLRSARQMLVVLLLQYASFFVLIVPIDWWHRRRGRMAYGLTRHGRSWRALVLAGVATAAITSWPVLALGAAEMVWKFGETVPWRQALFDTSWGRWEFWLFGAVLLFGVVPVLEELFYRGYCQRRLAEDWGDGAAIAGASCFFVFSHSQYLMPNAYNVAMSATLLVGAVGFGVVFAWTRSLVPSIIAHAILNVPMRPIWASVVVALFVIGAFIMARQARAVARQVFASSRAVVMLALAVIGAAFAIAAPRVPAVAYAAVGMLLVAVVIETRERLAARRPRGTTS